MQCPLFSYPRLSGGIIAFSFRIRAFPGRIFSVLIYWQNVTKRVTKKSKFQQPAETRQRGSSVINTNTWVLCNGRNGRDQSIFQGAAWDRDSFLLSTQRRKLTLVVYIEASSQPLLVQHRSQKTKQTKYHMDSKTNRTNKIYLLILHLKKRTKTKKRTTLSYQFQLT